MPLIPAPPQERKAKFKAILIIYMFIQFQDSQNYRDPVSKQKKQTLKVNWRCTGMVFETGWQYVALSALEITITDKAGLEFVAVPNAFVSWEAQLQRAPYCCVMHCITLCWKQQAV